MALYTKKFNSSLVKLKQSFRNLFVLHPVDTAQDAFEIIDEHLAPLVDFDREFGAYPIQDKEILYSLNDSITDLYFLIENFDSNLVDIQTTLDQKFADYKVEIDTTIQNYLEQITNEINNNVQNQIDSATQELSQQIAEHSEQITNLSDKIDQIDAYGNYNLTSSFASFTYESYEPALVHTITHNMNTFSFVGEPMVMNDDGLWERDIMPIVYLDENTMQITLTEERNIMLNMTAVEYFPSFIYEGTGKYFEISHGLNSLNLVGSLLIFDGTTWTNDIGKIQYMNENDIKIELTEVQTIKLHLMRI